MITLPQLPFANTALAPIIESKTIDLHYGKHHQGYVNKLNELIKGTPFENSDLETIIASVDAGPIFNNAAQIRNHTFYRNSLRSALENNLPSDDFLRAIEQKRGSFDAFKQEFITKATNNFGSGRTWLAKTPHNELEIINTSNAGTPLRQETVIGNKDGIAYIPLFTIDVWEHAYYLDYQNRRPDYLTNIRSLINWSFAENNFSK
ncbi:Superoxide dismutase [candidate division SR1 bacterium RAAC1_SR1_1]|nr:Superoxide dismutase [candidate division SR1 bacterium RAAC1_SR1_1]